jgi:integrase/recombinase XerD
MKSKNNDFAFLVSSFLMNYLAHVRNVSPNTIASYRDSIVSLLAYMNEVGGIKPEKIQIKDLSAEKVTDYLAWIEEERKCSIKTRNLRLIAIHSLFRYISTQKPEYMFQAQQVLAIPEKKTIQPAVKYLHSEEIEKLLAAPDASTKRGLRDQALLCLMYDSGCRVQELADIKVRDLRLSFPEQVSLTGKGRKTRAVPLLKETSAILKRYISIYRLDEIPKQDMPLFFNVHGEKLTRQGITYILQKYAEAVNLTAVSPHVMRHSKAMHLTEAEINPIYIRDFLGHSDLKTTQIYSKTSTAMKRKAIEKLEKSASSHRDNADGKIKNTDWNDDKCLMDWLKSFGK